MNTLQNQHRQFSFFKILFLGVVLMVAASSCTLNKNLTRKNLQIYKPNFRVHYRIVHPDTLSSQLALRISTTRYRLTLKAYDSYKGKEILFDETWQMSGKLGDLELVTIPVKAPIYVLEIILTNLNNNEIYHEIRTVNRRNDVNRITLLNKDNAPIVTNYVPQFETISFRHADPSVKQIYIKQFRSNFAPAPPPFSSRELTFNPYKKPQKQFILDKNESILIDEPALYFVQYDTTSNEGIFLNCFEGEDFPKLTNAKTLVLATRYITRNQEYAQLAKSAKMKEELDAFWLERGGTKERSRALISIYYNRVQAANEYFTTYKEGWKTDRGIVYTIFGPPDVVRQSEVYEVWIFRNPNYQQDTEMIFKKINGQYLLRRSSYLEYPWRARIYQWRKGLVR